MDFLHDKSRRQELFNWLLQVVSSLFLKERNLRKNLEGE